MTTTLSGLLAGVLLCTSQPALAQFPDSILDWIAGPPPIAGQAAYTAFHAESRVAHFDPQRLETDVPVSERTPWHPIVSNLQPFRSFVDRKAMEIYWRKDFFDRCPGAVNCSFYGEVMSFDRRLIYLRMESFPVFGKPIDDGKTWDVRPDKFRMPGGMGRIFAPIHIVRAWHVDQIRLSFPRSWPRVGHENGISLPEGRIDTLASLNRSAL